MDFLPGLIHGTIEPMLLDPLPSVLLDRTRFPFGSLSVGGPLDHVACRTVRAVLQLQLFPPLLLTVRTSGRPLLLSLTVSSMLIRKTICLLRLEEPSR